MYRRFIVIEGTEHFYNDKYIFCKVLIFVHYINFNPGGYKDVRKYKYFLSWWMSLSRIKGAESSITAEKSTILVTV